MSSFLPVPDPIAFKVFGLEIRWYAIMLVLGIIAGVIVMYVRAPKYGIVPRDRVLDFILWVIPIGLIGCRVYYVIFQWDLYKDNLISIFNIREGGIAIHGGLIFGITTAVLVVRHWKQSPLKWLDLVAPGLAIAQSIGRWGNYFNSEAHGGPTDLPWAIEVDGQLVHPTFLYESIWCFLLFLFLLWIERSGRKQYDGQLIILHLTIYSFERFFVEGLRTDNLMIGDLRQAQVISACIFVVGFVLNLLLTKRAKKKKAAAENKEPEKVTEAPTEATPAVSEAPVEASTEATAAAPEVPAEAPSAEVAETPVETAETAELEDI